jgi:PII-like signaling protein
VQTALPRKESILLRIFTGDNHRWHNRPLFEAIVLKARELQLAGATVLHGVLGFGKSSRLHQATPLMLSADQPIVIEIVDTSEKINALLPILEDMMPSGLITLERAQVIELLPQDQAKK